MKPIEFVGMNTTYAKDQPQYLPLPAHKTANGEVTSCWKMTWRERMTAFWNGYIWVTNATFNQPLQPQRISVDKPKGTTLA